MPSPEERVKEIINSLYETKIVNQFIDAVKKLSDIDFNVPETKNAIIYGPEDETHREFYIELSLDKNSAKGIVYLNKRSESMVTCIKMLVENGVKLHLCELKYHRSQATAN